MLSLSCKAAIKAVIYLGSMTDTGEKAGIKKVSKQINENEHTVGKLLQKMSREGIINSAKGPNGGFYVTAEQKDKPIIIIVDAIDGKDVFNHCGLGLSKCSETSPCPIHDDYKVVRDLFMKMCHEKTIRFLCENVDKGIAYLTG